MELTVLIETWNYKKKATFQNVDVVFNHYAQYSSNVKIVRFDGGYYSSYYSSYHSNYYSYFSVFDSYNVFFEQERREDLDFRSLCWSELLFPSQTMVSCCFGG